MVVRSFHLIIAAIKCKDSFDFSLFMSTCTGKDALVDARRKAGHFPMLSLTKNRQAVGLRHLESILMHNSVLYACLNQVFVSHEWLTVFFR